jgi:branched-chain amino acid aminotransferase
VSAAFEGIHAYWDPDREQLNVFRLREHLDRMLDSVRLGHLVTTFDAASLATATGELLRANGYRSDTYVRPYCFPQGDLREQMVPAGTATEVVIDSWPMRSRLGTDASCTVAVSSWTRFGTNVMPPRIKAFSNYHPGRLGNIEARARGADWPLFLNQTGMLTESSGANVGLVKDGVLSTPAVSDGVLPGITRATVLGLARDELGLTTQERSIERTELYTADEVFLLGTSAEILAVTAVDGLTVGDGKAGPVTRGIEEVYQDVVRGRRDRYAHWLTPVWT